MSRIDDLIVELCPDGVPWRTIASVSVRVTDGSHNPPKGTPDGAFPMISARNIYGGRIDLENARMLNAETYALENLRTDVKKGDILLTIVGAIGRVAVVENSQPMVFQRSVCVIKPSRKILDSRFFRYALETSNLQSMMFAQANGAAQKGLYLSQVKELSIPVPPLAVQREIVRILDAFTKLEAELEAELKARRLQYEYYRKELLSLPGVPFQQLGDIANNLDHLRQPVTRDARIPGDVPYYGASGVVDYVSDHILDGDYLLVSEDGANLLARSTPIAFSIGGKTWVNNHAHVLEFDSYAERRFVELYLNSIDLKPYISGSTQPKLNRANLNKIAIPAPSLEKKVEIVDILDEFDALINDPSAGLRAELEARRKQYEYYRDKLLTFDEAPA